LAPLIVQDLVNVLRDISQKGNTAILLVEQHARLALSLTEQAVVLDRGKVVHAGPSQELSGDSEKLHRLLAVS
jgi:branched-chain amino acid transport system ATP-binding protein